ncbi:MAG: ATP synthase subunit I [Wenzhouxiangellaceae bacterium]|nr:ATP synthase subunit I [Wenzhouxiangellaceae bacterium]
MNAVRPAEADQGAEFARAAVWLLRMQAVCAVLAAVAAGLLFDARFALAVLGGAGIGLLLTAVSALRAAVAGASPQARLSAFYRGMALKLAIAAVVFVMVVAWFPAWFVPVLVGFVVTLPAYWIALLRLGVDAPGVGSQTKQG